MFLQKQITLQQCVHHVVSRLRQWVGYTFQVSTETVRCSKLGGRRKEAAVTFFKVLRRYSSDGLGKTYRKLGTGCALVDDRIANALNVGRQLSQV